MAMCSSAGAAGDDALHDPQQAGGNDSKADRESVRPPPARQIAWPLVVAAYAVTLCVIVTLRAESTTDFRDFWENAEHFQRTGRISAELGVHNYLPTFTILVAPLGLLPLKVAIVLFTLLSLAAFALAVREVQPLLCGRRTWLPAGATFAAIALIFVYLTNSLFLGTVNVLLLALIVASRVAVLRGQSILGGVWLGLAIVLKLLPGALLILYLLERRWKASAATVAVLVALAFGPPLMLLGPQETIRQHADFYERAIRGHSAMRSLLDEKPPKANFSNNALPIVVRRLFSPLTAHKEETGRELLVNIAALPPPVIVAIYFALLAAILIGSVAAALRRGGDAHTRFGIWCCVMLLASPLVWTHYLVLAYWPVAVLVQHIAAARRAERAAPAALAALTVWSLGVVCLLWPEARAAGAQIGSVLALWAGLIARRTPADETARDDAPHDAITEPRAATAAAPR